MSPEANRRSVYGQIADHLRARIAAGELADGQPIPSLPDIQAEWGVSTLTARRAVALLAKDGLVEVRPGLHTVVVSSRTVPAGDQVAEELGAELGEAVRVRRTAGHSVTFTRVQG